MTNNEAAKWIQLDIDLAKIDPFTGEERYLNDNDRKTIEAMEMAINALTAQHETHDERTETHARDSIKRQDAIDAAIEAVDEWDGGYNLTRADMIADAINNNVPSAQPERPKGKWIDHTEDGYVECPFCHSATNCDGNKDELHFCFSCGADMRGEQDE